MVQPRSAKRQRTAVNPEQPANVESKHQLFTTWSEERCVEINGVLPQSVPGSGLGLVTTQRIARGERILFVPEEVMFKPDFTALRQRKLERISSQAKLALSALSHFGAKNSTWQLWLDTWPTISDFQSSMPMYWSSTLTKQLPSSIQAPLERQQADFSKDWQACQADVVKAGHTQEEFQYYWMIVNSRSFHWAPPKGGAGYMIMCPFIDYINHGPTESGCDVFQRSDGYEVIADRDYDQGEEILICYGSHGNDKLLVHYGFILPYAMNIPSIDDEVRIDEQIIALLSDVVKGQLSDLGYLGPFALVPLVDENRKTHGWEPCFKTQVAVRATLLTCNEWEFFAGNGDDLSGDRSRAVLEVLLSALPPLREIAKGHVQQEAGQCPPEMVKKDFEAATSMIKSRWVQIEEAVHGFLFDVESTS